MQLSDAQHCFIKVALLQVVDGWGEIQFAGAENTMWFRLEELRLPPKKRGPKLTEAEKREKRHQYYLNKRSKEVRPMEAIRDESKQRGKEVVDLFSLGMQPKEICRKFGLKEGSIIRIIKEHLRVLTSRNRARLRASLSEELNSIFERAKIVFYADILYFALKHTDAELLNHRRLLGLDPAKLKELRDFQSKVIALA